MGRPGLISLVLWDQEVVRMLMAQLRLSIFALTRPLCHVAGG